MKVSTKGRYALRIMIDLAENGKEGFVPLKDIGERQDITVKYLEQIISLLSKADLVIGTRGNGGGYKLSRKPSEYKIGDIFRASEGSFETSPCLSAEGCERKSSCKAADFWSGLEKAVYEYLDGRTLEELVNSGRAPARKDPSIWIL